MNTLANQKISYHFLNKEMLYKAYMSFIQNGGLFIRTEQTFSLGDEVAVEVTVPSEKQPQNIIGQVIWITPLEAQNQFHPGIGIKLSDVDSGLMRDKIETYLAGMVMSDKETDSL